MNSKSFSVGITDGRELKTTKGVTKFHENQLVGLKVITGYRHI
jgi:hypothetical protein